MDITKKAFEEMRAKVMRAKGALDRNKDRIKSSGRKLLHTATSAGASIVYNAAEGYITADEPEDKAELKVANAVPVDLLLGVGLNIGAHLMDDSEGGAVLNGAGDGLLAGYLAKASRRTGRRAKKHGIGKAFDRSSKQRIPAASGGGEGMGMDTISDEDLVNIFE